LLNRQSREYAEVTGKFREMWTKGSPPRVSTISVFAISNSYLEQKWDGYRQTLRIQTIEEYYHGTELACDIVSSNALCSTGNCGICGISCTGMDPNCIRAHIDFQRFGHGFYLAPNTSKCHDYTQENAHHHRAMLQCDVLPGQKYNRTHNDQRRTGPPPGFDSVYGQAGSDLNYPEIVVYKPEAVKPRYIVVYHL
jgi:hypothetical protein